MSWCFERGEEGREASLPVAVSTEYHLTEPALSSICAAESNEKANVKHKVISMRIIGVGVHVTRWDGAEDVENNDDG